MPETNTVTMRSRLPEYRWRDVQFHNHLARVSAARLEAAKRDPYYGSEFWEDKLGPKAEAPKTAPALNPEAIARLKKGELLAIATERGVSVDEKATREELITALLTPTPAAAA